MESFLQEEHTFLEFEKQVLKYNQIVKELQYKIPRVSMRSLTSFLPFQRNQRRFSNRRPVASEDNDTVPTVFSPLQVVSLGLFELRCDEVLRSLIKRTEAICSLLISRMSQENQKHNQM